jgi:hypothetical protein
MRSDGGTRAQGDATRGSRMMQRCEQQVDETRQIGLCLGTLICYGQTTKYEE